MGNGQNDGAMLIEKEAFYAIGLKWKGTFQEAGAGQIRPVHEELQKRLKEIRNVTNPEIMLGLSYHARPDGKGFTHYAAVEVEKVDEIPPGMVSISVPTLKYALYEHRKGQGIEASYSNIYKWIANQGYQENNPDSLTHFEKYPMKQDPYSEDPEFTIMIPIK
ncbi:MAG TPA: GyrI-like domain-containing protein [Bacillaceae bacterium]